MNTPRTRLAEAATPRVRGTSALRSLGIDEVEELVYRALLEAPVFQTSHVVDATGLPERRVRRALVELESIGLVSRSPTRPIHYVPASPQVAIEALAVRRLAEVTEARLAALEFQRAFRDRLDGAGVAELVEVVSGAEALTQRLYAMMMSAQREVLAIAKPPYVLDVKDNEMEVQGLRRGVALRYVYDQETLDIPGQVDVIFDLVAAGAEIRVLAGVPMKLFMTDGRHALIALQPEQPQRGALVVHESPLLDALGMLFEALWQRASPIRPPREDLVVEGELTEEEARVLTFLAAGMKDQAIARRLGTSYRNVQRTSARILAILNAESRFQAGIRAREKWGIGETNPTNRS